MNPEQNYPKLLVALYQVITNKEYVSPHPWLGALGSSTDLNDQFCTDEFFCDCDNFVVQFKNIVNGNPYVPIPLFKNIALPMTLLLDLKVLMKKTNVPPLPYYEGRVLFNRLFKLGSD